MTHTKIKNTQTGFIFELPLEEAERLYREDNHTFEFLDKKFKPKTTETKVTTVFKKVVGEEKPLEKYTYAELKAYCKANGLKQTGKTADLLARALEHQKQAKEDNK